MTPLNDDALGQLLRDADAASAPPELAGDLPARIHTRLRRRQITSRMAGVGLVMLLALVFAARYANRPPPMFAQPNRPPQALAVEQLKAEAEQLASEAAVHERVARALLAARQRSLREHKWQEIAAAPDPVQKIDEARDLAAAILVNDAARMPLHLERARELYRNAAQLFPDTRAGKRAAGMLKQGA